MATFTKCAEQEIAYRGLYDINCDDFLYIACIISGRGSSLRPPAAIRNLLVLPLLKRMAKIKKFSPEAYYYFVTTQELNL